MHVWICQEKGSKDARNYTIYVQHIQEHVIGALKKKRVLFFVKSTTAQEATQETKIISILKLRENTKNRIIHKPNYYSPNKRSY